MCPLIGPSLRSGRLRRGLTLQDAAHKTRISVPRLRALEADDYATFGNSVYARSFLKLYADFLHIDATETLEWLYFNPPQPAPKRVTKKAVSVVADPPIAVHAGYGLWDGQSPEQRKSKSQPVRAPSPVPAVVSTFVLAVTAVGLWLNTLSQDWQRRQAANLTQPAQEQPAGETFAYNFRTRPIGHPEPKQIVATATPAIAAGAPRAPSAN